MGKAKKIKLSTSLNILPPEMIEKILKLLDCKTIFQAQLVCKRWKVTIDKGNLKKIASGEILFVKPELMVIPCLCSIFKYSHGQELFYNFVSNFNNKLVKQLLSSQ